MAGIVSRGSLAGDEARLRSEGLVGVPLSDCLRERTGRVSNGCVVRGPALHSSGRTSGASRYLALQPSGLVVSTACKKGGMHVDLQSTSCTVLC